MSRHLFKSVSYFPLLVSLLYSCENIDRSHFSRLSQNSTGVTFRNLLVESESFNVLEYGYMYNGGGVAVGDINNDGLEDIYFTGNMVRSHLYLNRGDFDFEEIAISAGVDAPGLWNTGTTMVDVNNDGLLDIFVARSAAKNPIYRKNLLFINNGDLTFTEMASAFGITDTGYTTQVLFFDYDRDGDLDLYVLNHSIQDYAGFSSISKNLRGLNDINYGDRLYENQDGFFIDRTVQSGILTNVLGFGLGVSMGDFNNDGWPDLYVSNDYNEPDYLYINNQDGTFSEDLRSFFSVVSMFSMGSSAGDINNDGLLDLVTLDMLPETLQRQKVVMGPDNYEKYQKLIESGFYYQSMRNMLHINQGGEFFSEVGQLSGISNTDWSWSPLIADFDNDGFKDLFVTNGYKKDYTNMDFINYAVQEKIKETEGVKEIAVLDLIDEIPSIIERNYLFKNIDGIKFRDENIYSGLSDPSISHGAGFADLDNDGDLDLIVNNTDDYAGIYKNNSINNNRSLQIILKDTITSNLNGIGTKVDIFIRDKRYSQVLQPTHGFQSSSTHRLHFGVSKDQIDSINITWSDGGLQTLISPKLSLIDTIIRSPNIDYNYNPDESYFPIFEEVTARLELEFSHKESEYIDFKENRLLPYFISTEGPSIAIGDVNQDMLKDFYITGTKDSAGELWLQNPDGSFVYDYQDDFDAGSMREEVDAIFLDIDNDGDLDLYTVAGSIENQDANDLRDILYLNVEGKFISSDQQKLDSVSKKIGSLVLKDDFDKDGDIDLFIGTRNSLEGYPLSDESFFLINNGNGEFDVHEYNLGNITDGKIADMNMDGNADIVLVKEWGAIEVIYNKGDGFKELDRFELIKSNGLWKSVDVGDFNNDGLPDIIAGNFGTNNQLREQMFMVYKDFDLNGSIDPILCVSEDGSLYPFWSKDDLASQLPAIQRNYSSYEQYSKATLEEILSQINGETDYEFLYTDTLESSLFINIGNGQFRRTPLPDFSQISPIYDFLIHDFDKDGNLDFLSGGNLFGTRVRLGRNSTSKVELFFGEGDGTFKHIPYNRSGIYNKGEARAFELITTNFGDILLLINSNDSLRAYRNTLN